MKALAVVLALLAQTAWADNIPRSFPAGTGARYQLHTPTGNASVTISIAESSAKHVVVEMYFAGQGFMSSEMWQQYVIDLPGNGAPVVREGYMLRGEASAPERMPADVLAGLDNASVADFLIASRGDLDRWKRGDERVVVPASGPGGIAATKYEQPTGSQVVTYWISDDAKPLGLVKLVSRGTKPAQSYEFALESVLTHVGTKIDRKRATPLTAEGRAVLNTRL
jgi:hypothetical protein